MTTASATKANELETIVQQYAAIEKEEAELEEGKTLSPERLST